MFPELTKLYIKSENKYNDVHKDNEFNEVNNIKKSIRSTKTAKSTEEMYC